MPNTYLGHTTTIGNADLDAIIAGYQAGVAGVAATVPSPAESRTVASLQNYLNHNAIYNAKDFGAIGNGIADDTAALQLCLNTAVAAHGQMFVPVGDYVVTDSLLVQGSAGSHTRAFQIRGAGYLSRFLNHAGVGKPTIKLRYCEHYQFADFSIVGYTAYPNDAIMLQDGQGAVVERVGMWPNGKGIHLKDHYVQDISQCLYWPSGGGGGGQGATVSAGTRIAAVYADGTSVNATLIRFCNIVGFETIADGGAGILWNTDCAQLTLLNNEIEPAGGRTVMASIDLISPLSTAGISDIVILGNYVDNTTIRIRNARFVTIQGNYGSSIYTIGDGTAPNACAYVTAINQSGYGMSIDAQSFACGAISCDFDDVGGYSNLGASPLAVNVAGAGGVQIPDSLASTAGQVVSGPLRIGASSGATANIISPRSSAGYMAVQSGGDNTLDIAHFLMYGHSHATLANKAEMRTSQLKVFNSGGGQLKITLDIDGTTYTFVGDLIADTLKATGAFGCNTKTPQTAYASGGALNAYGAGANGFDTAGNASALYAMVVAIRAALVANGIMT